MMKQKSIPQVRIIDVAPLVNTRVEAFSGERLFVATGDVEGNRIVGGIEVTYNSRPSRADVSAVVGDVLFARMQDTNKVLLVDSSNSNCVFSTGFAVLRPTPKILSKFLFCWLSCQDFANKKDALCTGATQKAITNAGIERITIPLLSFPEQQRIVSILDEADALRQLRARADIRINDLIPALFDEMFGDPLTNQQGWAKMELSKLCEEVVDCPHSTPVYSNEKTPFACIRSSDIQNGILDWSTTKYVDRSEYEKRIARLVPSSGDVVYCREGARFGNAAIVLESPTICLGQRMMLFRANRAVATPEFIWGFLESLSIKKEAARLGGGSASPHLNVHDIKMFTSVIPPLSLQREFAARVAEVRALQAQQARSRQRLEDLFQALLHRAFAGEL